jgi:hypothetical protein
MAMAGALGRDVEEVNKHDSQEMVKSKLLGGL